MVVEAGDGGGATGTATDNKPKTNDNTNQPVRPETPTNPDLTHQALTGPDATTVGIVRGPTDHAPAATLATDGSIILQANQGNVAAAQMQRLIEANGGDQPRPANVHADDKGNITQVDLPGGKQRTFTYKDGQLDSITEPDGKSYHKEGDKWVDKEGKPAPFDQPLISNQGDLTYGTNDRKIVTENHDGTSQVIDLDNNTNVQFDANNRVTSVHYGNNETRFYDYDKNTGELNKITLPDGTVLQRGDKGQWTSNGAPVDINNATVNRDGTVSYKNANGDNVRLTLNDTTELKKADGSTVISNSKGQVIEVDYQPGTKRTFTYGDDGKLNSVTEVDGQTYRLQDGKWVDKDGKDTGITAITVNNAGVYSFEKQDRIVVAGTDGKIQQTDLSNPPGATLSPEAARKAAHDLHDAITHTSWWSLGFHDDPETDKIMNILGPLNKADMAAVAAAYKDMYNKKDDNALIDDIHKHCSDVDYRRAQALLNREDGRTNDAGQVMVALATANSDHDKGNAMLLQQFSQLNALQIEQLRKDFQAQFGESLEDAIAKNKNIRQDTRDALQILEKGVDNRTAQDDVTLARMAVDNKDMNLFGVAVAGESPEARAARQFLQNDPEFMKKFEHAFYDPKPDQQQEGAPPPPESWENTNQIAKDFLQEGHISLATITSRDTGHLFGWFDNKENLELACKNATPEERHRYEMGMQLALGNQKPTNDEQQQALDYYNKIHDAFKHGGNNREQSIWEDELLHGRATFITDMARTHNDGYGPWNWFAGHNTNELMSRMEGMSEADWKLLHDPSTRQQFLDEVQRSLQTYASKDETNRIMDMLRQKADAPDYEHSKDIHRSLFQVIEDNKGHAFLCWGTSYDQKNIVHDIAQLTSDDARRYKEDSCFRNSVDAFVKSNMSGDAQAYARMLLDEVAQTGQPPKVTPAEKILDDKIDGVPKERALADIRAALQDKDFQALMQKPDNELNDAQRAIKKALVDQVYEDTRQFLSQRHDGRYISKESKEFNDEVLTPLLHDGHLPPSMEIRLGLNDKPSIYADIASASPEEQKRALDMLNGDERKIAEHVIANGGKMDLADQIAQYTVSKGDNSDLKEQFKGLSFVQIEDLRNTFATRFGRDMDGALLNSLPEADRQVFKNLLSTQRTDGRQDFYDNLIAANFSGISPDGSQLTAEKALQTYQEALADYNAKYKDLPKDIQLQLDQYFGTAMQQYRESKEKLAEIAVDAAITAAAITAVVASGGTLAPAAIALLATGAAAFRVGAMKVIEGNDFDSSPGNIVKQAVIGFTSFALNCLGPEMFAAEGPLMTSAVEGSLATIGAKTALQEGGETALKGLLKQGFEKGALDGKAVDSFIAKYLTNPAEADAFRATLQESFTASNAEMRAAMQQAAQDQARQWAEKSLGQKLVWQGGHLVQEMGVNAGIASGANVVSELVVAPFSPDGLNPDRLLQSALTGAAVGAGMTILLKPFAFGAGKLAERFRDNPEVANGIPVNVTKGPDNTVLIDPKNNLPGLEITRRDGTVVKVEGNEPIKIEPGDNITRVPKDVQVVPKDGGYVLTDGEHEVPVQFGLKSWFKNLISPEAAPKDPQLIDVNGRTLLPNYRYLVGRDPSAATIVASDGAISRQHAWLEYRDGHLYITDNNSTYGTYINGKKIEPNTPVEIKPTDKVTTKGPDGPRLFDLATHEPGITGPVRSPEALNDSNNFGWQHEQNAPLRDGWTDVGNAKLRPDGTFEGLAGVGTVVDRTQDRVLNDVIESARTQLAGVPPQERAQRLLEFVQNHMNSQKLPDGELDAWYAQFVQSHAGQRVLLGDFIAMGRGGCAQQAELYKVLADELFKDVPGAKINLARSDDHVWTTVDLGDGKGPRVFDPRAGADINGRLLKELPQYQVHPEGGIKFVFNGKPVDMNGDSLAIGRANKDLGITDMRVSASHGDVRVDPATGKYYYRDHSTNGTWINGEEVHGREVEIKPGDEIHLGSKDGPALDLWPGHTKYNPNDAVKWQDVDGWHVQRVLPNGDVVLTHDGVKELSVDTLRRLNPDIDRTGIQPGGTYKVQRSDGTIEEWEVSRYNKDTNKWVLTKKDAITETVPGETLQTVNRPGYDPDKEFLYGSSNHDYFPDLLDPDQRALLNSQVDQIIEKFSPAKVSRSEFRDMLNSFPPEDRDLAMALLQRSMDDASSSALRDTYRQWFDVIKAANGGSLPSTVYTLGADSSGNFVGYFFRKTFSGESSFMKIDNIDTLISKYQRGETIPDRITIMDDLSNTHLTPAQREILSKIPNVQIIDTGAFEKGVNLLDMASGRDAVQAKLQQLVQQAHDMRAAYPHATPQQIARGVLDGSVDQVAATIGPNAHVLHIGSPDQPLMSVDDLYKNLIHVKGDKQAIADYLAKFPPEQRLVLAKFLTEGTTYRNFTNMMERSRELNTRIIEAARARGIDPKDIVYVTNADPGGSSHMISYLHERTNGIPHDQFVSMDQLRQMAADGTAANKMVVYLDDTVYSGDQASGFMNRYHDLFAQFKGTSVATYGTYTQGIENLANTQLAKEGKLDFLYLEHGEPLFSDKNRFFQSLTPDEQAALRAAIQYGGYKNVQGQNAWTFMIPDNDVDFLQNFLPSVFGIPTA